MHPTNVLRAWAWKETREHALGLAALLAGIAICTAAPFFLFPTALRYDHLEMFPALAVLVAGVAVGSSLFGREIRGGMHALILRTPRAMRGAFVAKTALWILAMAAALAVEEIVRISVSRATGVPLREIQTLDPDGRVVGSWSRQYVPIVEFGLRGGRFPLLVVLAIVPWLVVGSAATRGGSRAFVGVALLLVLAAPLVVLIGHHPWWLALTPSGAVAVVAALGATAGLALASAWFRGRRIVSGRVPAIVLAAAAATPVFALATVVSAISIDRMETPDAYAPDFRIEAAWIGEGGRFLFMETSRGRVPQVDPVWDDGPSVPARTWVADLERGTDEPSAWEEAQRFPPSSRTTAIVGIGPVPVPWVVRHSEGRVERRFEPAIWWRGYAESGKTSDIRTTWIDARTGRHWVRSSASFADDERPLIRETARATTPVRDGAGRRVWWFDESLEREASEGSERIETVVTIEDAMIPTLLWDGFEIRTHDEYRDHPPRWAPTRWFVRADGTQLAMRVDREPSINQLDPYRAAVWPSNGIGPVRVDALHGLRSTRHQIIEDFLPERAALFGDAELSPGKWEWAGWTLADLESGTSSRVDDLDENDELEAVAPGVLLRVAAAKPGEPASSRRGLVLWKPLEPGAPTERLASDDPTWDRVAWFDSHGRVRDGRVLLRVLDERRGTVGRLEGREAWLLFDRTTKRLDGLTAWSTTRLVAVAVEPDGAFVAIEDGRRVVRFRERGTSRSVLFPHPR